MDESAEAAPQDVAIALRDGGGVLIDVREPAEYEEKHIPGSVHIPLAELPDRLGDIPVDRDVYVHCHRGGRSARAVELLRRSGRPRAINVSGGIDAWSEAGLPTE
ncbi:MAG: rhodanese-like domain-containing protein [Candidatus Dormibacteria bacterium]